MPRNTPPVLDARRCQSVVDFGTALHSSLDLSVAFARAMPILADLVGADHVGLAVSRPGSLYDYEWLTTSLPESFLANYVELAQHDFVLRAVAPRPNQVLRDHEMLERDQLERNAVYQHANATAGIEQVMATMLVHNREWTSGLSLYRSRRTPFSDADAAVLQMLVPQIGNAVQNSREHAALRRELLLRPAVEDAGIGVIWLDSALREISRTDAATHLIETYFESHERGREGPPRALLDHLQAHLADSRPGTALPPWRRARGLGSLQARFLRHPQQGTWSILLRRCGVPPALEAKLTPRLVEVAASVIRGMSNEDIATRDGRALAMVKQQVSEVYKRLELTGRADLVRLATGVQD